VLPGAAFPLLPATSAQHRTQQARTLRVPRTREERLAGGLFGYRAIMPLGASGYPRDSRKQKGPDSTVPHGNCPARQLSDGPVQDTA